jgi:hypothetical protein
MSIGDLPVHLGAITVKYERLLLVLATVIVSISASRFATNPGVSPSLLACLAGGVLLYVADAAREIATLVAQVPEHETDMSGERHKVRCELVAKYAPRHLIAALALGLALLIAALVLSMHD